MNVTASPGIYCAVLPGRCVLTVDMAADQEVSDLANLPNRFLKEEKEAIHSN